MDFSATAYRNEIRNLINFGASTACLSNAYGCYSNVAQATLQGLSLAGSIEWTRSLKLAATLDLQAPKDATTGLLLARRARQFGTVRADTTALPGWDLGAGLQFAGKRYNNAANTQPLGGYALLNLDASYALSRDLKLQLNVENAFDRRYQTALDYAQAPRTLMIGLRYTPSL
jgi:vitamin B12 transporter